MRRYHVPPEWAEYGAHWGDDGLLYLAEWRRGFTPHELRALFFECQQVRTLRRERDDALARSEQASNEIERLEKAVFWYRRQVTLEARLYPLIAGIQ